MLRLLVARRTRVQAAGAERICRGRRAVSDIVAPGLPRAAIDGGAAFRGAVRRRNCVTRCSQSRARSTCAAPALAIARPRTSTSSASAAATSTATAIASISSAALTAKPSGQRRRGFIRCARRKPPRQHKYRPENHQQDARRIPPTPRHARAVDLHGNGMLRGAQNRRHGSPAGRTPGGAGGVAEPGARTMPKQPRDRPG